MKMTTILIRIHKRSTGTTYEAVYAGCTGLGATANAALDNLEGNLWAADHRLPARYVIQRVEIQHADPA